MRKTLKTKKIISLFIVVIMVMASTTVFGAWWGTPGYEWALKNNLTSVKSKSQLNKTVTVSDFYNVVLKYLRMKGITPSGYPVHHEDNMDGVDNIAKGIFEIINDYNEEVDFTVQQYYIVENYVEHAKKTLEEYMGYSSYLTKDSLKNIQLYLDLSKYKAAKSITNRSDREYILSKLGNVKYSEIIDYGIMPYVNNVTREEFLIVMYDLLSGHSNQQATVVSNLYNAGILVGYGDENGYGLDKNITYTEMLTFLYRFEIFDFSSGGTSFTGEDMDFSFNLDSSIDWKDYGELMEMAFEIMEKGEENITEDDVEALLDKLIEFVGEENLPKNYKEDTLERFREGTLEEFMREMIMGTK